MNFVPFFSFFIFPLAFFFILEFILNDARHIDAKTF